MRYGRLVLAIALTVFCVLHVASLHPIAAIADDNPDAEKVYAVSYRFNGLPVWTQDGKALNPALLVAYLSSAVDTAEWGKTSRMAPYPPEKPVVLVISTTSTHHEQIKRAIERLQDSMMPATAE